MAATITRAEYDAKKVHDYAGRRGADGMAPADENGDVWWLSNEGAHGTCLVYGFIKEELVLGSDAACAVGRFDADGPHGYRAKSGGPLRATRAEAEADQRAALEAR